MDWVHLLAGPLIGVYKLYSGEDAVPPPQSNQDWEVAVALHTGNHPKT